MASYINDVDGALVLEFGFGDLVIGAGHVDGKPDDELVIWPKSPGRIGDTNVGDIGKTTDEVKALVRMVFHDPHSLDVFIHQAQELRTSMLGKPWTAEEHDRPA